MPKRFVWREGQFVDPLSGQPMDMPERDGVCCPRVMSDIEPYASPIDGKMITSRSARRYDLESNNCHEVDPPSKKGRGYKNPNFALKRNLPLTEEARENLVQKRKEKQ